MLKLEEYLANPCESSSLPYWKLMRFSVPENILVVHDNLFRDEYLLEYNDKPYFRLMHDLSNIPRLHLKRDFMLLELNPKQDADRIAELINNCYSNISVSRKQVIGWSYNEVFSSDLWIGVSDKSSGELVAVGIADFDRAVGEGILEWIQVLPKHQRQGIGAFMVSELLSRVKGKASFVTVSGEADNKSRPEMLYRHCGFTGDDLWHILYKK